MPGEHFIFGIITECYRYFYGAMMPECNFYSQFKLENNVSLQNSKTENIWYSIHNERWTFFILTLITRHTYGATIILSIRGWSFCTTMEIENASLTVWLKTVSASFFVCNENLCNNLCYPQRTFCLGGGTGRNTMAKLPYSPANHRLPVK